ncbi:MAG: ATP-binding protein [Acidobacteriia bacterium]|nr:ATP-binding protein [Terriglobia bacterium]
MLTIQQSLPGHPSLPSAVRQLVRAFGLITLILGGISLLGWSIGSGFLISIRPNYIPMAPNSALSFVLLGLSLLLLPGKGRRILLTSLAVPVILLSALRTVELVGGIDLGVDHLLLRFPTSKLGLAPTGHMSLFTAIAFVFAGAALVLSCQPKKQRLVNDIAIIFSLVPGFIGIAFLLGYLYGAPLMYGGAAIPVALNTAIAFVATGVGLVLHDLGNEWAARHEAELALRQAYDQMEERVQQRTAEVSAAHQELQKEFSERKQLEKQLLQSQKMEAVGRLAGGIAHDFNNLLTIINGYSELLLQTMPPSDPRFNKVGEIREAGERAKTLIRQLLAFSRRQVLQPRIVSINEIVKGIQKMLQRLIGEDVEVSLSLASSLAPVKADPGQLEQVLLNLAVNSRDAMPQGGRLTIETDNVVLDETYAQSHAEVQPGPYVMMAVSDTGCGMDAETLTHVFEPFFTTKEQGKGTGLGLSTVYGIVEQSGGTLWVYSVPGQGTTFKIYLPAESEPVGVETAEVSRSESLQGTESVLVVEDDEGVRRLTCQILHLYGYKVLEASNGKEALEICRSYGEPIHLTLTDVIMPHIGGRELAEQLVKIRPEMKVLYMSGYTDDTVIHQGLLHEGTPYLQKPFSALSLAQKVRQTLGKK